MKESQLLESGGSTQPTGGNTNLELKLEAGSDGSGHHSLMLDRVQSLCNIKKTKKNWRKPLSPSHLESKKFLYISLTSFFF